MQVSRLDIERELRSRFALYKCYEKQKAFHNSHAAGKIISGGNQCGKSQPISERILTPSGWVKMGDIKPNDYVIGSDGKAKRVLKVFPQGVRPIYKITFHNCAVVRCDEEHLWTIQYKRDGLTKYYTYTARDCKARLDRGYRLITPQVLPIDFNISRPPIDPYFFGLLLGDGSFRNGKITITNIDPEIIDYCEKIAGEYNCYIKRENGSGITYRISSFDHSGHNDLMDILRSFDLMGATSHEKYIPDIYKFNSFETRLQVLRGLIDTDGSIDKKGMVEFYSVNKQLCQDVYDIAMSLGIHASVKQKRGRYCGQAHLSWRVTFGRTDILLSNLPRKKDRQFVGKNSHEGIGIKSIEPDGQEECQCILIDSEDSLYVTNDFILTHNTVCGTHEVAFHATGIYPSDWYTGWKLPAREDIITGKRVCNIIVAAPDSKTLRDSIMKKIVGTEFHDWTDGLIARKYMVEGSFIKSRGVPGLLDNVQVRRADGSICTLYFRSYEQGRENLQSITADYVYCDEEPPQDVYAELMARLTATKGHFAMAFTPLKGLTPLVQEYWNRTDLSKELFCMSIYEVDHIAKDPEKLAQIKSNYSGLSESEREARMMGIPAMGSGTVYPVSDEVLKCDAFSIPSSWKRVAGLDFGRGDHPIACVWLAFSPEGVCYVYDLFKLTRVGDAEIAAQILSRGKWIPVAWPHDFVRSSGISTVGDITKTEGWKYKDIYEKYGIEFTDCNAKTEEGSTRVEAGLVEVRQAMVEGRFRVFSHLSEWFKEKATYLYKEDGSVTKVNDDILDATRYGFIMRRYAVSEFEASGGYDDWYGRDMNKAIDDTLERD